MLSLELQYTLGNCRVTVCIIEKLPCTKRRDTINNIYVFNLYVFAIISQAQKVCALFIATAPLISDQRLAV